MLLYLIIIGLVTPWLLCFLKVLFFDYHLLAYLIKHLLLVGIICTGIYLLFIYTSPADGLGHMVQGIGITASLFFLWGIFVLFRLFAQANTMPSMKDGQDDILDN